MYLIEEPTFDLIAGVYRQALHDARRGKLDAIGWLDCVAPDWRELQSYKRGKSKSVAQKTVEKV